MSAPGPRRPMFTDEDLPSRDEWALRDYIVKKWKAVGIFNDKFDHPSAALPGAEADIESLRAALLQFGCVMDVHTNRTGDQICEVVNSVVAEEGFGGEDAFLLLLWSHGE